jgi:hypothetical protein
VKRFVDAALLIGILILVLIALPFACIEHLWRTAWK